MYYRVKSKEQYTNMRTKVRATFMNIHIYILFKINYKKENQAEEAKKYM